jgi:site-specific DNA-methyltransferase (adenine-specific)
MKKRKVLTKMTNNSAISEVVRTKFRQYKVQNISDIKNYEQNSRTHSKEQIQEVSRSIKEFGFTSPLLVDEQNVIIAGHCRVEAAKLLGMDEIPTIIVEGLSDVQKAALVIADNKLALNAGWDFTKLGEQITFLRENDFDTDLTGFKADEIATFMPDALPDFLGDEDDVPEPPADAITKLGDIWLLGNHRLLCGDSTSIDAVEKLMASEKADMVFTDPPYNVDYEGYTEEKLKIQKDDMSPEAFIEFLVDVFSSYALAVKDDASMYVCHGSIYQREFQNAIEQNGFTVRCQIIWAKNTFGWGFGRYKFQHEPIFYCYKSGSTDNWYGDKSQATLWEVNKPAANKLHPTMKPIELIEIAINNSSKRNDLVLDLFGGSGSTLIASEKTGRRCNTMELDPKYCDVIVSRWEKLTGKKAELEVNNV